MIKTILRSSVTTVVLFVAAAVLIVAGSVGAAQASPRYISNDYRAEVQLTNIHVALTENGVVVEDDEAKGEGPLKDKGALLNGIVPAGEEIVIGKVYAEDLAARNVGVEAENGIPQYVRATVTKYWVNEDGTKATGLNPDYIHLNIIESEGWTIDHAVSDNYPETTVLYYMGRAGVDEGGIVPQGGDTGRFADSIMIDSNVLTDKAADGSYAYKGKRFEVKVVVDAVQTHNGTQAMTSAWGRTNEN